MRCPYCGNELNSDNRCPSCGEDVAIFKRLYHISNRCYNEALAKAKERDLTGATEKLKNCLKIDKRNTDARNLLGLIYYEEGEVVSALSEWVISKNYKKKDNLADKYISLVQDNPTRLATVNQLVKKYNSALRSAKNGNPDIAIIALKKVTAEAPHYLQALQLLALCYIRNKDYVRAKNYLESAYRIDNANPITGLYLEEVNKHAEQVTETAKKAVQVEDRYVSGRESFAPVSTYKEYHPNFMPWITLIAGLAVGIIFSIVVIMPGIRQQSTESNRDEFIKVNEQLAKANSDLDAAKSENERLSKQIDDYKKQLGLSTGTASGSAVSSESAVTVVDYDPLYQAAQYYFLNDKEKAADTLVKLSKDDITDKSALALYNTIADDVFADRSASLFVEGRDTYNAGKYDEAIKLLKKSLKMNPDNVDSIYFLGRAYDRKGNAKTAAKYYQNLIDNYSNTSRASEAKDRLAALGL
ncbi:MAG: tetratricopeptide repeat protein [Catonella sp.]|jgi:tetratricopeptide (TPR) repeat protein|nr:tetratricopeptide repeat protein [Catonella sp.]MDY6356994.1 tetratricopeptide repeat protein [Catonella sp.]